MARGIVVPIIGDPDSVLRAINKTIAAGDRLGASYKKVGVTAEESAQLQIRAAEKKDARLRQELAVYRQIADTAEKGSREQVTAANLAAQAQGRLSRSLTVSEHEQRKLSSAAGRTERDFGKFSRGAIVGSGAARSLGRSIAFASGSFLGGVGITFALKSFVAQASTLQEETEKTGVVFGQNAREVQRWSRTLAGSFGVSTGAALQAAGVFGNMFHSLHFGESDAATMSQRLVQLAADMASFNNASPEETLAALQSGLAGQVRPLRQFGVFLSDARIKAEALSSGIAKNAAHLTAEQKVRAAYNIILRDTAIQQGDVARNTQSLSVAESKLKAALANSEAAIGRALLPTLVKYTNELGKWLNNSKNQARIQRDVNKTVETTKHVVDRGSKSIHNLHGNLLILEHGWSGVESAIRGATNATEDFLRKKVLPGSVPAPQATGEDVRLRSNAFRTTTGEDVRLRGGGALGTQLPESTFSGTARRLGLLGRFAKADLRLAKAERTKITSDDRAALEQEAAIVKDEIASRKKAFRDKATLERQLGGIENQIDAIDKAKADERKAAAAARKQRAQDRLNNLLQGLQLGLDKAGLTRGLGDDIKAAQAQVASLKQQVALNKTSLDLQSQLVSAELQLASLRDQQLANQKAARQKQLDAAKKARDEFTRQAKQIRDVIQSERDRIGTLFSGPIFNPTDAQQKRALGAPTPGADAKKLIADLKGQIQQFRSFERDLRTLQRRGAPPELLNELRQQGFGVAPQVHALATASGGTLAQFKSLFLQRERLAVSTAKQEQRINIHFDVHVVKGTGEVKIVRTTPHGQKRGNNPGVVVNPAQSMRP